MIKNMHYIFPFLIYQISNISVINTEQEMLKSLIAKRTCVFCRLRCALTWLHVCCIRWLIVCFFAINVGSQQQKPRLETVMLSSFISSSSLVSQPMATNSISSSPSIAKISPKVIFTNQYYLNITNKWKLREKAEFYGYNIMFILFHTL